MLFKYVVEKQLSYFDQSQAPPPLSNTSVTIKGMSFTNVAGTINSLRPGTCSRLGVEPSLMVSTGDGSCISDPCWYGCLFPEPQAETINSFLPLHRYHVADADGTQSIIFDDFYADTVQDISATNILVIPDRFLALPKVICNASVTPKEVGFKCWDGLYLPTGF